MVLGNGFGYTCGMEEKEKTPENSENPEKIEPTEEEPKEESRIINKEELPISRTYRKAVMERLSKNMIE